MRRELSRGKALTSAALVVFVLCMAFWGIRNVAIRRWAWQETFSVRAEFHNIGGLEKGARVRIQGIDAGVLDSVGVPDAPGKPVLLTFRLDSKLKHLVRSDARARIATEGVVGAKVVEIEPGRPDAPALGADAKIAVEPRVELSDLLRDAQTSLKKLDATVSAAETGLNEFNAIATSIREGKGSLGKFIQDDEAHRKLMALSESSQRTMTDLDENLSALKRTWPISRYFDDRAYFDKERVLFQPGADRQARTFAADDLFERGRSVLTSSGQTQLDNLAGWLKVTIAPKSEFVIAAFTDDTLTPELAQALTQEQAETVRKYLNVRHKISSAGWFSSRKVAVVGFGSHVPRALKASDPNPSGSPTSLPTKRVEIIVFTPRT